MTANGISDLSGLRRVLTKAGFDVNRFVKNTARDGNQATEDMLEKLSVMSDDASSKMKQAVFENYKLFIKAGKAATELEATVHQIHSDFTEKEQVMNALVDICLFTDTAPRLSDGSTKVGDSSKLTDDASSKRLSEHAGAYLRSLAHILEFPPALLDDSNRRIILDGELSELSVDTYSVICVARLFLLDDMLLIAYNQSTRSLEGRYRIQVAYLLDTVDVFNVVSRDRRFSSESTFKISSGAVVHLFQADSIATKQLWVRVLEETKRSHKISKPSPDVDQSDYGSLGFDDAHFAHSTFSRISERSTTNIAGKLPPYALSPSGVPGESFRDAVKALRATLPECVDLLSPLSETPSPTPSRRNPFGDYSDARASQRDSYKSSASGPSQFAVSWLWDAPEDLDVAISERDFSRATELVCKTRQKLDRILSVLQTSEGGAGGDSAIASSRSDLGSETADEWLAIKPLAEWLNLSKRISRSEESLVDALQKELLAAADRHGGPRSIRTAVANLGLLGKWTLASQLFLLYRSSVIARTVTHGVRQEGSQLVYMNRFSFAFHRALAETAAEWKKNVVEPLLQVMDGEASGRSKQEKQDRKTFERLLSLRLHAWILEEADKFSQQLRVLLVDSRSVSFYSMALAAHRINAHADKITELIGVDVRSALHSNLSDTWRRAAEAQAHVLRDAVEHRAKQELWEPITSKPTTEQEKYLRELAELGLIGRRSVSLGIPLTTNTCQLIRSLYHFIQSGKRLDCDDLTVTMNQCVAKILRVELENYERALHDPMWNKKLPFIRMNLEFLIRQAIPKLVKPLGLLQYPDMRDVMTQLETLFDQFKQ